MCTNAKHCETDSSLFTNYTAKSKAGNESILLRYTTILNISAQAKFVLLLSLIGEKHYTIHNEKRGNKFSFLQNATFRETKFSDV